MIAAAVAEYLILGCGYTGRRVVERLLPIGARVIATTRDPGNYAVPEQIGFPFREDVAHYG